jgi:hypothetical protein
LIALTYADVYSLTPIDSNAVGNIDLWGSMLGVIAIQAEQEIMQRCTMMLRSKHG